MYSNNELNYRYLLAAKFDDLKKSDHSITYSAMAEYIQIRPPYLSKVLNNHANFSDDQLYLACEYLKIKDIERDFFLKLLVYDRTIIPKRKKEILNEIKYLKKRLRSTSHYISVESPNEYSHAMVKYYTSPFYLILHMAVSIEKYAKDYHLLSKALNIPTDTVLKMLEDLKEMELICYQDGQFKLTKRKLHLGPESDLCRPHQNLIRQYSFNHFLRPNAQKNQSDYNLFLTLAIDKEAKEKILEKFFLFLQEVDLIIDESPCDEVYQLNFDLFSWTKINSP